MDVEDVEDVEELPGDVVAERDRGRTVRAEAVRVVRIEGWWKGRDSEGREITRFGPHRHIPPSRHILAISYGLSPANEAKYKQLSFSARVPRPRAPGDLWHH